MTNELLCKIKVQLRKRESKMTFSNKRKEAAKLFNSNKNILNYLVRSNIG